MRVRKQDADGDYVFGHGEQDFYVDQAEGVGQDALTRLRLWQGEWFLDTTTGTPYFTQILGKVPQEIADQAIQKRVLETPGVQNFASYFSSFDSAKRELTVTMTINTIYGQTEVSTIL